MLISSSFNTASVADDMKLSDPTSLSLSEEGSFMLFSSSFDNAGVADDIKLIDPPSLSLSEEGSFMLISSSFDTAGVADDIKLSDPTGVLEDESTISTASGNSDTTAISNARISTG